MYNVLGKEHIANKPVKHKCHSNLTENWKSKKYRLTEFPISKPTEPLKENINQCNVNHQEQ